MLQCFFQGACKWPWLMEEQRGCCRWCGYKSVLQQTVCRAMAGQLFCKKNKAMPEKKVRLLGQWLEKGGSKSWWQYKGVIWHSSVTTAPLRLLFIGPDGISKGRVVFSCNISSAITTEPCVCSLSSSCKASLTLEKSLRLFLPSAVSYQNTR